jgi:ribosome biogenesis GTPase
MAKKQRKVRADLRKNRNVRTRQNDLTRNFANNQEAVEDMATGQSVSGKGELTRKRTVVDAEVIEDATGEIVLPAVDQSICLQGRVLRVQGLHSAVQLDDGMIRLCATRLRQGIACGSGPKAKTKGSSNVLNPARGS